MALHVLRHFVPGVHPDDAARALARIIDRRGWQLESEISHTAEALVDLRRSLLPGTRLFTQFAAAVPGGSAAWMLDQTTADVEPWDPLLASELSAELGAFAVSVEASRSLSRRGLAAFFAGRTIEFEWDGPEAPPPGSGESSAALIERTYRKFADLYVDLTGSSASELVWNSNTPLRSSVVSGLVTPAVWNPRMSFERPLALAVFALAEGRAFAAAWDELPVVRREGWFWSAAATTASQIAYVVLAGARALDTELCTEIARHLDVPAAAAALHAPCAPFDWWNMQPGETSREGQGLGAFDFVRCLMPATVALGERPGILRTGA